MHCSQGGTHGHGWLAPYPAVRNNLHRPIGPRQLSRYSSLSDVMTPRTVRVLRIEHGCIAQRVLQTPMPPHGLQQPPVTPLPIASSSTPSSDSRVITSQNSSHNSLTSPLAPVKESFVPMPPYGPDDRGDWVKRTRTNKAPASQFIILFEPSGDAHASRGSMSCTGVPMTDCLTSPEISVMGAHDRVLSFMQKSGRNSIILKLRVSSFVGFHLCHREVYLRCSQWPGYENSDWGVEIPIFEGTVPRYMLAYLIAYQFQQFFHVCEVLHYPLYSY